MKEKHREVQVAEEYCWARSLTQSLTLSVVLYLLVVIISHSECLFYIFTMTDNSSIHTDTYIWLCVYIVCTVYVHILYTHT